jgi:hypothetical protein
MPRHFAVRQVNPYDGVLQVVADEDARAYSANGRVWQIQAAAERPDHTWRSVSEGPASRQFFNFGLWDPHDGLHQVPANPVLDIGAMSAAAERLIARLSTLIDSLPFGLVDHIECWSMDAEDRPIALLATTEDRSTAPDRSVGAWQATRQADQGFIAPSLLSIDTGTQPRPTARAHAERLEHEVRTRGREQAWFDRSDPNKVDRLDANGKSLATDTRTFPPLGLTTDWADRDTRALVQDYLDWQAPRLLLLPNLSDELRGRLEQAACRHAVELSSVYSLLPRIVDHTAVEAARVEAKLRRAQR